MALILDYETGNRSSHIGATNEEVMAAINPSTSANTYSVSYIYDSFAWDHCKAAGISIANLLNNFKQKYS